MPGIILCGAEGEQFLFENTLTTVGADDKRRGSVVVNLGQQMFRQFDTPVADFWVHVRCTVDKASNASYRSFVQDMIRISSGTTVLARVVGVAPDLDAPVVGINVGTGTGPQFPHAPDEFLNYDIRVQVVAGVLKVWFYRNEVLRHYEQAAGTSWTAPDRVLIQPMFIGSSTQGKIWVQDTKVTDAIPTVGMELATLVPSAVGNFDAFTNDYTAIDDLGYNQSSAISTVTPNDRESWFFADPEFDIGDKVIYGLVVNTVAQADLAGVIDDFNIFLRIGSTNYDATRIYCNAIAPNAYVTVFTTNPSTSAPWTQAQLIGLEAGVRGLSI